MPNRILKNRACYSPSSLDAYRPHVSERQWLAHVLDTKAADTRVIVYGSDDIGKKTMVKLVLDEYGYVVLTIDASSMTRWDELFCTLDGVRMTRTDVQGRFFAVVIDGVVCESLSASGLDSAAAFMRQVRVPVVFVCTPHDAGVVHDIWGDFALLPVENLTQSDVVTYTMSVFRDYFAGRCPLFSNKDLQPIVCQASHGFVYCFREIAAFLAQYEERERNGFMLIRPPKAAVVDQCDEDDTVRVGDYTPLPCDDELSAMYADTESQSFGDVHDTLGSVDAEQVTMPAFIRQMQAHSIRAFRISRVDLALNVVYGYFGMAALMEKMRYDARYALAMRECMSGYGILAHMLHNVHPDMGSVIASAQRLLARYAPAIHTMITGHKRASPAPTAPVPLAPRVVADPIYHMAPDEYQKYMATPIRAPPAQSDKKPAKRTKKLVLHPNQQSLHGFINKK